MAQLDSEIVFVGSIDSTNQQVLDGLIACYPGLCAGTRQVLRINKVEVLSEIFSDGELRAQIFIPGEQNRVDPHGVQTKCGARSLKKISDSTREIIRGLLLSHS